jgi:hypothetical protein
MCGWREVVRGGGCGGCVSEVAGVAGRCEEFDLCIWRKVYNVLSVSKSQKLERVVSKKSKKSWFGIEIPHTEH